MRINTDRWSINWDDFDMEEAKENYKCLQKFMIDVEDDMDKIKAENQQLKKQIEDLDEDNTCFEILLKKEIDKCDKFEEENQQLKKQIESMRNCENMLYWLNEAILEYYEELEPYSKYKETETDEDVFNAGMHFSIEEFICRWTAIEKLLEENPEHEIIQNKHLIEKLEESK